MNKFNTEPILSVKNLTETVKKELVQRITRNLLDIQILRLIRAQSMWGYKIKKQAEAKFNVRLRHGALYPLLNTMESKGFLTSERQQQGGRTRKVYTITQKGEQYLKAYRSVLREQMKNSDVE
jgi:DNA-binding PadR family transcriptional regulator